MITSLLVVPWFLWSAIFPGGSHRTWEPQWESLQTFDSQEACEAARPIYQREIDKVYPAPTDRNEAITWPHVYLRCSPVKPSRPRVGS